jgi:pimeloyl-ACP methyl ester carboxylesterase
MPQFPHEVLESYHDGPWGRMRSRTVGRARPGTPEIVLVQGLAVSDYLLPGVAALGEWTRAHLLDLPGLSGSGDPPHELGVSEYGRTVADWITTTRTGTVVLAGHSSGTQIAAEAAAGHPYVKGLVLAAPTIDPAFRTWSRLIRRWRQDGKLEPPGMVATQIPEWKRAGPRRILHLVRALLHHDIEEPLCRLTVPVLVLRGEDDRLSTPEWTRRLAAGTPEGRHFALPGAHSFPWHDPHAWSAPIREFSRPLSDEPEPERGGIESAPQ